MPEDTISYFADPGQRGAIAVVMNNNLDGMTIHKYEDPSTLIELFLEYKHLRRKLIMENVPPFTGATIPSSRSFKLGENCGLMEGIARGMFISCEKVSPKKWQSIYTGLKGLTGPKRKRKLKDHAAALYPSLRPTLVTCDAILIAHFFITNR